MSDLLKFDLDLKVKPLEIGGEAYAMAELTGVQRDRYLTAVAGRLKHTGDSRPTVKSFDGLQSSLVGMALRKLKDGVAPLGDHCSSEHLEEQTEPVKEVTIQGWPAAVVSALFKAAKDLSGLDEEDEEDEGND